MIRRPARVIYAKEIVDTLRDRRTLATMLLVPMVLYPLSVLFTSQALESEAVERDQRTLHVLVTPTVPEAVRRPLVERHDLWVETASGADGLDDRGIRNLLRRRGDLDVAVSASATASAALDDSRPIEIALLFDATRPHAESAVTRVEDALKNVAHQLRDARLARFGLSPAAAEPIAVVRRSVSTSEELGNQAVASVLPSLILLFIAVSAFYPAVDLTAGEKERRTLGTLLSAPVSAVDLVTGKYLAVLTVGTLAGLLNVAVLVMTLLRIIADSSRAGTGPHVAVSFAMLVGLFLSVVLVAMPIAALMLLFGTLSRSFRDASTLLSPVLLLVMLPAFYSTFPSSALSTTSALVPLANAALLMKALVLGQARLGPAVISVLSSLLFTSIILLFSARTFADERVLFSTEGRRADLRSVLFSPPPAGASTALAFAGIAFVITYYVGLFVPANGPLVVVVATQLAAYLVPAMLLARWLAPVVPSGDLLRLARPRPRHLLAGTLVGLGAWLAVSIPTAWLTDALIPGQQQAGEAFVAALGLDQIGLLTTILVLAVLPAIVEELAFRGALLSLLGRTLRPRSALVLQAAIFGIMHASIYRLLPTAALGLLLGLLALRTGSIWPGALTHALTNTLLILADRMAPAWLRPALEHPSLLALAAVFPVGAGLLLLPKAEPISRGQTRGDGLPAPKP